MQDLRQTFSEIYQNRVWGSSPDRFYSGAGSHAHDFVDPYVQAIHMFVQSIARDNLSVLDIGCGDFNIGSKIRHLFGLYLACDVVPDLIDHNKQRYPDIDFKCVDAVRDPIPSTDLVLVRQVLQHLSNHDIQCILNKISHSSKYVIITEHKPIDAKQANLDIQAGAHTRATVNSYVDVLMDPFNWTYQNIVIAQARSGNTELVTTLYFITEHNYE